MSEQRLNEKQRDEWQTKLHTTERQGEGLQRQVVQMEGLVNEANQRAEVAEQGI